MTASLRFPVERFFPHPKASPVELLRQNKQGFTELAIAVITGNHDYLKYLLSEGEDPSAKDTCGFTPMLYACALNDTTSMRLLLEAQKIENVVLDVFHHFPGWNSVLKPQFPMPTDIVCTMTDGTEITAEKFQELTGARFYNGMIAEPQEWVDSLADQFFEKTRHLRLTEWLLTQYDPTKPPPNLQLGLQGNAGYGVFANEKITPGQIVGIYGGELHKPYRSVFRIMGIDSAKVRNLIPMVNDGFPNCGLHPIFLPDGRTIVVLVTIREVEPGKALSIDYGSAHPAKKGPHNEIQLEKMEAYFKEADFKDLIKIPNRDSHSIEDLLSIHERFASCLYLKNTPSALMILCIKGIVSYEQAEHLVSDQGLLASFPNRSKVPLVEGLKTFQRLQQYGAKDFEETMVEWLQKYPYQAVIELVETERFEVKLKEENHFHPAGDVSPILPPVSLDTELR